MSSILRFGKFVRCFSGIAKNINVNSFNVDSNVFHQTPVSFSHSTYATTKSILTEYDLESQIKKIDNDVRRIGRIKLKDIEELLQEVQSTKSVSSSQSLLLLRCCGDLVAEELPSVRTHLAQNIWKTLCALQIPMDISHYNALLRVYIENDYEFSPTDFLYELQTKGLEPNRVTYQRLIKIYCLQGDINGATKILEFMQQKGIPLNEDVFNSLILGHSKANDLESSKSVPNIMAQAGINPSSETFSTLLCCLSDHGKIDEIENVLEQCEREDILLSDKDLLNIIFHLTICGHYEKIDGILSKLHKTSGFNQDAVNIILKLINKGQEDVAIQIFKTMPRLSDSEGSNIDSGYFFIKQLMKADVPVEKVILVCEDLMVNNINTRSLEIAFENGTANRRDDLIKILMAMQNHNLPIRQHFFWPMICNNSDVADIIKIVQTMKTNFDCPANFETIKEYIIPNLKESNIEKIVQILKSANIPTSLAATTTAVWALNEHKINDSAVIFDKYQINYNLNNLKDNLVNAFIATGDVEPFVKILKNIFLNIEKKNSYDINPKDFIGDVLQLYIKSKKEINHDLIEKTLLSMKLHGLSMSTKKADSIQELIGSAMNSKISQLLEYLVSNESKLYDKPKRTGKSLSEMSLAEIQEFIVRIENKGENAMNLKKHYINTCYKSNELSMAEIMYENMKNTSDEDLPASVNAQMIDMYCNEGHLDKALLLFNDAKQANVRFDLDRLKILKICSLLLEANRTNEAVDFIKCNKNEILETSELTFKYKAFVWRLLDKISESGDNTFLNLVFSTLRDNNYLVPTNVLLGPLIKVHLVNNDMESAIITFEKICYEYKGTPWKNELTCRLIQSEDSVNLQKITDLSTNIHGEINSLYDLVFSFIECGRIKQARKILETPGLQSKSDRITVACERFRNGGQINSLENLVEATKDLNFIDRGSIYYNLLLSYEKEQNVEKALELWTKMQEDNFIPTDVFMSRLADFLKSKNVDLPFVYKGKGEQNQVKSEDISKKNNIDDLSNKKAQRKNPSKHNFSYLEELLKDNQIEKAKIIYNNLSSKNNQIPLRIMKFYLNKMAGNGEFEEIQKFDKASNEIKKKISYDNKLCQAFVNANKTNQFLDKLKDNLENCKSPEEIKILEESFPRGGALGILEKNADMYDEYKRIAIAYSKRNIIGPMNVLWTFNLINSHYKEARELFDEYLISSNRIMFQRVLTIARQNMDEILLQNILDSIHKSKISEGAIGNVYSCYIDVLIKKSNLDGALNILEKALEHVSLEQLNYTALKRLEEFCGKHSKSFIYKIPSKNSNKTSSSSSDEEGIIEK